MNEAAIFLLITVSSFDFIASLGKTAGISGIALGIVFVVYWQIIKTKASKISQKHTFVILYTIVWFVFILVAWSLYTFRPSGTSSTVAPFSPPLADTVDNVNPPKDKSLDPLILAGSSNVRGYLSKKWNDEKIKKDANILYIDVPSIMAQHVVFHVFDYGSFNQYGAFNRTDKRKFGLIALSSDETQALEAEFQEIKKNHSEQVEHNYWLDIKLARQPLAILYRNAAKGPEFIKTTPTLYLPPNATGSKKRAGQTHLNCYLQRQRRRMGWGDGESPEVFCAVNGPAGGADAGTLTGRDTVDRHCRSPEWSQRLE